MSGGFFRGTSADQDTRFSNKQAKLLKSQKFPAELDQLVDMKKVQMEVIKPWIATRVTELLGFEDEVLINFIFGLLDAKEVDGKQIQIQLTGFMEKNTAKFMRELWGLLLSAQQNASGVPQQFLDAKAEEIIMKKAESDRIVQEIQRKREKEAKEQQIMEQHKRTDQKPTAHDGEDTRGESKHGSESRGRNFRKSGFEDRSPSNRKSPLASRSRSNSPLRKDGRARSRSVSPVRRRHRSPRRSPPPRRRSPYYPSRRRSPSPFRRRRSPYSRRRSPDLVPRRSPSPPPPPSRRPRSPSPLRRRQLSPSPSPPLPPPPPPPPRRSSPQRKRSLSPDQSGSPSYRSRGSLIRDTERLTRGSRSGHDDYKNSRDKERRLPDQHINGRETVELADAKRKDLDSVEEERVREKKVGPNISPVNSSPARSESPRGFANHDNSPGYKRHVNVSERPIKHSGKQSRRHDSPDESVEEERPTRSRGRDLTRKHKHGPSDSPEEREYGTRRKAKDAFTPDEIASPQRHLSSKQSTREGRHSPPHRIKKEAHRKKHYREKEEEEPEYGPDPYPTVTSNNNSDEMEKHGRSHDNREKRRHKKSRKHRKYSDESSVSDSLSDESERDGSSKKRRREEKRRLKREEKKQRRKRKGTAPSDIEIDPDMRERSEEEEEEAESEKEKRLEIELREKAIQSLRAKKSATH